MSDYLDPNNEELLKDFFSEAQMQVEVMEQNILALEDDPGDHAAVDEIFRVAHTLKGGAATVQMTELSGFTHLLEDLLDEIRSGKAKITGENIEVLLSSIDVVKAMIAARTEGGVYKEDYSGVSANLKLMAAKSSEEKPEVNTRSKSMEEAAGGAKAGKVEETAISEYEKLDMLEVSGDGEQVLRVRVSFDESNLMNSVGGIQVFAKIKEIGQILKTVPDFDALYEDVYHPVVDYYVSTAEDREALESAVHIAEVTSGVVISGLEEIIDDSHDAPSTSAPQEAKEEPVPAEAPGAVQPTKPALRRGATGGSILRVNSRRIDSLLNLVSESVINKATFNQINTQFNQITAQFTAAETDYRVGLRGLFDKVPGWLNQIQQGRSIKDVKSEINTDYRHLFSTFDTFESQLKSTVVAFRNTAAKLGRNTSDLHEAILRIRMVPLSQIFSRFPRLVRDLSKSLDKKIGIDYRGRGNGTRQIGYRRVARSPDALCQELGGSRR